MPLPCNNPMTDDPTSALLSSDTVIFIRTNLLFDKSITFGMIKSVNLNTIVVAIKRYADSFEQKKDLHDETLLKNARLSLTESMMDINLEHDAAGSDLTDLLEKFTQITQNYDLIKIPGSFRILTEDMESVRKLLESIPNVMDLSNNRLVRIKITVSEESRADVGSSVIGLLHGNGIEFVDAYFSQENMIITFNREDASRAYDVLRSEIG